jgi:sugar phosphate permease
MTAIFVDEKAQQLRRAKKLSRQPCELPSDNAPSEGEATSSDETPQPDSDFSNSQKKWIVFIAASAGWFSTASSFIYFPAIPFLARDLDVSIEKINITVTAYLIASGVFPTLAGSAADRYGRRPAYIIAIGVYVAINIGLAVQRDYAALVTLRMLQSAAISGKFPSSLMRRCKKYFAE